MNDNAAAVTLDFPDADDERPAKRLRLRARVANMNSPNPLALLSFQAKKANEVWTQAEFTNLCDHLHNANGATHYVMGFRDNDRLPHYVRAKRHPVQRAISWSWQSIAGSPRSKLAFVPYASNDRQQSRWGGLDFDAHHGEADRARELAFGAFRCLLNQPDLCVILETSGSGGWHVWAISPDFHDTRNWVRLLKSVAALIGVPITAGICEIFPPDSLPSRYGRGLRAPGCWNPTTDTFSEVVWENTRTSLEPVLSGKSKIAPLNPNGLQVHFPDKRKKLLSLPSLPSNDPNQVVCSISGTEETILSLPALYRESDFLQRLGITFPRTRNLKLAGLTGAMFHQVGYAMARLLAETQFKRKTATTKATEQEHMASFEKRNLFGRHHRHACGVGHDGLAASMGRRGGSVARDAAARTMLLVAAYLWLSHLPLPAGVLARVFSAL